MLLFKKILAMLLITTVTTHSAFSMKRINSQDNLENFEKIKKQKTKELEEHKNKIITYYENKFEDVVGFECAKLLAHVENYLEKALKKNDCEDDEKRAAVIFDIDETCLSSLALYIEKKFNVIPKEDTFPYRKKAECPAIRPVLKLVQELKKLDIQIFYISSRREALKKETAKNLNDQGFDVDQDDIFLMPPELFEKKGDSNTDENFVGKWKESIRNALSQEYDIIASMGDSEKDDFYGGNCGFKILLQNLLY